MKELYYFWKSTDFPESSGHGITIIPGLKDWVLIHATVNPIPTDAIPASKVVKFLNNQQAP